MFFCLAVLIQRLTVASEKPHVLRMNGRGGCPAATAARYASATCQ
jgi:hypothetical protein